VELKTTESALFPLFPNGYEQSYFSRTESAGGGTVVMYLLLQEYALEIVMIIQFCKKKEKSSLGSRLEDTYIGCES